MAVLSGHNLACVKKDRTLFENIHFRLDKSEILYVQGPNGAGKTSLLRILVGLSEPDCGEVTFEDVAIDKNAAVFHHNLIYIGHKPSVNAHLSAIENLSFWCKQHQISTSFDTLMSLLGELGLVGLEDLPVSNLSAGQQRRVALARLWLKTSAKLWILDEPFTALDVQGIDLLQKHCVAHLKRAGSIIMTSHQKLQMDYPVKELILEYQI